MSCGSLVALIILHLIYAFPLFPQGLFQRYFQGLSIKLCKLRGKSSEHIKIENGREMVRRNQSQGDKVVNCWRNNSASPIKGPWEVVAQNVTIIWLHFCYIICNLLLLFTLFLKHADFRSYCEMIWVHQPRGLELSPGGCVLHQH